MCMIDNGDGLVTMLSERQPRAKKEHKCDECHRVIAAGEVYTVERFVFEREPSTHKTCKHCSVVREWLQAECGGYLYGAVEEDIREHAEEGYGMPVARLAVGMAWKWRRPSGAMLPVPAMPMTTHERMRGVAA